MNLYSIGAEYARLGEILEMEELTPELEAELNDIVSAGDDKLEACYHVFANYRAQIAGIDEELARIQKIKASRVNGMERLKRSIEAFMKITNRDRYENGICKIILAKKTNFVYEQFPEQFTEIVSTTKQKLSEFKTWAKLNKDEAEAMGAYFVEDKSIQIK